MNRSIADDRQHRPTMQPRTRDESKYIDQDCSYNFILTMKFDGTIITCYKSRACCEPSTLHTFYNNSSRKDLLKTVLKIEIGC